MRTRKAITSTVRFEVFKRDNFMCVYCGRRPPEVELTIDHIIALASGGSDYPENLTTACAECNNGKTDRQVSQSSAASASDAERRLAAAQKRMEMAKELQAKLSLLQRAREIDREVSTANHQLVVRAWREAVRLPEGVPVCRKVKRAISQFIRRLPVEDLIHAASLLSRIQPKGDDGYIRYFCAVCWKKFKAQKPGPNVRGPNESKE